MKFYKDKDPYIYSESLYDKKLKRQNKTKRIISALMAFQIFCNVMCIGTSAKYKLEHSNPFEGSTIISNDFSTNYMVMKSRSFIEDERLSKAIEYIKNSNIDEKKAYLLYYALISNDNLIEEEKQTLTGYIKYFVDNKYLNYEYVYNQLNSIIIKERNAKFPGTNISSTYNRLENSIKLGNIKDLPHEVRHSIMDVPGQTWLNEGYDCIISEEYDGDFGSSVETNVIRVLCEMMGKEKGRNCFFYMSSVNSIEPLSSELKKLGIEQERYEELYCLLNELSIGNGKLSDVEMDKQRNILRKQISGLLAVMIRDSNIDKENMNSAIINELLNRISLNEKTNLNISNFYYFNTEKINEYPIPNEIVNYYYPVEKGNDRISKNLLMTIEDYRTKESYYLINPLDYNKIIDNPQKYNNITFNKKYLLEEKVYYDKNIMTTNLINKETNEIIHSVSEQINDVVSLAGNYEYYQNQKIK